MKKLSYTLAILTVIAFGAFPARASETETSDNSKSQQEEVSTYADATSQIKNATQPTGCIWIPGYGRKCW